ncbi:MAG: EAL domain-containing protein [Proteobacteria bacterium]|nr:EAL domain-containing protein [Pseudomonadota bacterium]
MSTGLATAATTDGARPPRWVDRLCLGLLVYTVVAAFWMLTGLGGERVRHYVGLLADTPACVVAFVVAAAAARRQPPGPTRTGWHCLALALALYGIATAIGVASWLRDTDPFPGIADVFNLAFYPFFFAGLVYKIRAAAVRVRWLNLSLDALVLVAGFGAFFWFLIIRQTAGGTQLDVVKTALSQTYIALNCVMVLALGVLLLAAAESRSGRRVALLLSVGFATMLLGDVAWSVAKITGHYLSGDLQDALYVACYLPLALAARERLRAAEVEAESHALQLFAQALPYASMFTAFAVLVMLTHGDVRSPTTVMTIIVFALALLTMLRQALVSRQDALIRERRAARLVEDRYASLIANASDVIMIVAEDGTLRFASPASERTLGLRPEALAGRNLLDAWAGEDRERLRAFLAEVAASQAASVGPVELRLERGHERLVVEVVGSNLSADPAVEGLALNLRDITERKGLEEKLRQLAFHDPLTLLANRSLFRDRVQHSLALAQRGGHQVAVMFIDLDNFKNVNDSLGHEAGDRLLQAVAQRLMKSTRAADTVARLGGDEFAILVEGFGRDGEVESLAGTLIDRLDQPFPIGAAQFNVSASIGVAFAASGVGTDALLSRADIAMYHAKSAGKNRFAVFQPPMQSQLHERMRLEADIGRALREQEFVVEYQPIVDLGSRSLLGVEALVRWQHPELGRLAPRRFIQIAEESGQIARIERWVLAKACRELRGWRETVAGGRELRLAVNISGRHLQHGDLVEDVAHALEISGFEPGNLVIELTESTIMHNTEANLARLLQLKALGVKLAIDDFGTGYSSLSYLHRFPIDILKIDQSFVSRLTNSDNGPELARAVITLGDTLGLDTVAEGIELEEEAASLLGLGCVAGQGYLFQPPATLAELTGSPLVANRERLWNSATAAGDLSPTGRFDALETGAA